MKDNNIKKYNLERAQNQKKFNLPQYTFIEEIINSATHGLGVIFAIIAITLLLIEAPKDFSSILFISIYGLTLFLLYIISTIYHGLNICMAKKVFRILDHCSIFLLIAGTYTPITTLIIGGRTGTIILIVVWLAAFLGIAVNWADMIKYSKFSMFCYIAMGWGVIFAVKPLIESVTLYQLWMLIGGGIAYTVGAVLYVIGKKVKYMHSVWHLFVLLGSVFHFNMIYNFLRLL